MVRHYRALGVDYFQIGNEPNLRIENGGQAPSVDRYLELRAVRRRRRVIAAGGLPAVRRAGAGSGDHGRPASSSAGALDGLGARAADTPPGWSRCTTTPATRRAAGDVDGSALPLVRRSCARSTRSPIVGPRAAATRQTARSATAWRTGATGSRTSSPTPTGSSPTPRVAATTRSGEAALFRADGARLRRRAAVALVGLGEHLRAH